MNKIGITGATGCLGKTFISTNKNLKIYKFKGDIRNKKNIHSWINDNNINIVIHLAAVVPIKVVNKNKKIANDVNYLGTKNLVDECIKKKIDWFFFASTSHVYRSSIKKIKENDNLAPISYYGQTKKKAEDYILKNFKKKKINYCIGRIFSTTNKNQKKNYLVPDLIYKIKKAKNVIILENLNHYRDFISMVDISKIIILLMKKKFNGILNLGLGKKIHLKVIAKIIANKYKKLIRFKDNKKPTYLIANINKLKKIYNHKLIDFESDFLSEN